MKFKAHLPTLSDEEALNALSGKLKFQPIPSGLEQGAGGYDKLDKANITTYWMIMQLSTFHGQK